METRPIRICDECKSSYFDGASAMASLCPECAHHFYGYANCDHRFESGRRLACGWDGSRSDYIAQLLSQ